MALRTNTWGGALVSTLLMCGCGGEQPVLEKSAQVRSESDGSGGEAKGQDVSAAIGPFGSVAGSILIEGNVTTGGLLDLAGDNVRDREYCSSKPVPDESLLVNSGGKLKNCFIYLRRKPVGGKAVVAPLPELKFDQQQCRFNPHVMVVHPRQPIRVLNSDGIGHNTHTLPLRNTVFNQVNQAQDLTGLELVYTKAETVPVQVVCDVHPWMRAYHLVVDHPYAAVTDDNGRFQIEGLPVGKHIFRVWHERSGDLDRNLEVKVKADGETQINLIYPVEKFLNKVQK